MTVCEGNIMNLPFQDAKEADIGRIFEDQAALDKMAALADFSTSPLKSIFDGMDLDAVKESIAARLDDAGGPEPS